MRTHLKNNQSGGQNKFIDIIAANDDDDDDDDDNYDDDDHDDDNDSEDDGSKCNDGNGGYEFTLCPKDGWTDQQMDKRTLL